MTQRGERLVLAAWSWREATGSKRELGTSDMCYKQDSPHSLEGEPGHGMVSRAPAQQTPHKHIGRQALSER